MRRTPRLGLTPLNTALDHNFDKKSTACIELYAGGWYGSLVAVVWCYLRCEYRFFASLIQSPASPITTPSPDWNL